MTAYTVADNAGAGIVAAARAARSTKRCRTTWPRPATSSAGRSTCGCSGSASGATARRPACSSTASSTRVSGSRRSPASRPPSGSCATTRPTRRRSPTSTTSTSSSCRRSNPDGGHVSFYDRGSQRKNMTNYCGVGTASGNVGNRGNWGVDLNRNNTVGTLFDGYAGAGTNCTSDTFAGPSEASEPEIKNEHVGRGHVPEDQVRDQHPHARRLLHVVAGRVQVPGPRDAAGAEHRHREVLLRRLGDDPVAHQAARATR